jgi:hypothetical protein
VIDPSELPAPTPLERAIADHERWLTEGECTFIMVTTPTVARRIVGLSIAEMSLQFQLWGRDKPRADAMAEYIHRRRVATRGAGYMGRRKDRLAAFSAVLNGAGYSARLIGAKRLLVLERSMYLCTVRLRDGEIEFSGRPGAKLSRLAARHFAT